MSFVLPLMMFAFAMALTLGPNNVVLAASGANFGFCRTVPHMLGIVVGVTALVVLVAVGIGSLLLAMPEAHFALRVVGAGYLLFLAYRIATAAHADASEQNNRGRPLSFLEAASFQKRRK